MHIDVTKRLVAKFTTHIALPSKTAQIRSFIALGISVPNATKERQYDAVTAAMHFASVCAISIVNI